MEKRWHYVYVILYPALDYKFYYGSRITDVTPAADVEYFGSLVTFAQYNDAKNAEYQADALKVVLHAEYRAVSRTSLRRLAERENTLIREALEASHVGPAICINRNIGGRIYATTDERRQWGSLGGKKSAAACAGIHAFVYDRRGQPQRLGAAMAQAQQAKTFKFLDPAGNSKTVHNLRAFCRKNNLDHAHMCCVHRGSRKNHKGWSKP